jgi:acyl carrier protein
LRGRTDQTQSWRERFPLRDEQEVQRFLQVIGELLGLKEERMRRLRPDDRPEDLTQDVFCGDGMGLVELMMAIEEAYGLELPDGFLEKARTLGDLFDYVTRQADARAAPRA